MDERVSLMLGVPPTTGRPRRNPRAQRIGRSTRTIPAASRASTTSLSQAPRSATSSHLPSPSCGWPAPRIYGWPRLGLGMGMAASGAWPRCLSFGVEGAPGNELLGAGPGATRVARHHDRSHDAHGPHVRVACRGCPDAPVPALNSGSGNVAARSAGTSGRIGVPATWGFQWRLRHDLVSHPRSGVVSSSTIRSGFALVSWPISAASTG
jgi:hypothetical protein